MLKIRNCLERQRDINMLRTREQEQDTALRYLVHELKNSLNIIGSYSNIALLKNDAMKYLKTISTTAVHAENLLNDASLLSHLEKDCAAFTLTPVTLSDIVEDVTAMFHDAAMSKHVEIGFQNGTAALIMGNQTGVRQVLVNLVSNAVKYNRDNGTVLIRFDETGDWVKISITDEGCGVSAEELPRIFDKFYRAAGSERIKGTGLGLYIVKLLITAIGGTIAVTSIPGQGSTFIVSFQKHRTSMPEKRGNDEEPIARTL
jgi:two-component system phosphate regulon sensor histidine kinase PhoR